MVNTPEILAVIDNIPMLANFLNALYDCDYKLFFQAFPVVTDEMRKDRYMVQHVRFFEREMRIVAYTQFLESYAPPPPAHTATAAAATHKRPPRHRCRLPGACVFDDMAAPRSNC